MTNVTTVIPITRNRISLRLSLTVFLSGTSWDSGRSACTKKAGRRQSCAPPARDSPGRKLGIPDARQFSRRCVAQVNVIFLRSGLGRYRFASTSRSGLHLLDETRTEV